MIDVAFTGAELRPADITVVIDVLRATSTAASALSAGYRFVFFAESIERARELRTPERILAGERRCLRPDGFDQGNSPLDARERLGTDLVLATTNGAPTVVSAAKRASVVLLGSLLNLDAVIGYVLERTDANASTIQLACAGTNGAPAIEDVYVAGAICAALPGPRTDAALIAEAVTAAYEAPLRALSAGANAQLLRDCDLTSDIGYCALTSELACVPVVVAASSDVAIVADSTAIETLLLENLGDELCASVIDPATRRGYS